MVGGISLGCQSKCHSVHLHVKMHCQLFPSFIVYYKHFGTSKLWKFFCVGKVSGINKQASKNKTAQQILRFLYPQVIPIIKHQGIALVNRTAFFVYFLPYFLPLKLTDR